MKKYTVSLTFQCNENWDKMTPKESGRHCGACNKIVIDFSTMKDEEIVEYLLKNKNSCGRFQQNQLSRPMVIYNNQRRLNWPAMAAMLIAGFVSVAPKQLNAMQGTPKPMTYYPVEGEKNTKKVEPDKAENFQFTIRLFKTADKTKILNSSAYINKLGSFVADANGDIQIQISNQDIPEVITVAISTSGYGYHEFTIYKKDLKNSTSADLFLDEVQMPAGMVSIHEN